MGYGHKGYMLQTVGRKTLSYSESEIELLFQTVFTPFNFTDEICKWMQDYLLTEHKERSKDHYQHLSALQARYKMLEKYIDQAYEDKVSGAISESLWRDKNGQWLLEQSKITNEINAIGEEKQDYIEKGVCLIELAQDAENIYKNGSTEVKRKLVEFVSSNHVLRDGSIGFNYAKPFSWIAEGALKETWWICLLLSNIAHLA